MAKILIETDGMSEMQAAWLVDMFRREAEDAIGTAEDERLRSKGSDGEASMLHEMSANEHTLYSKMLLDGIVSVVEQFGFDRKGE